MPVAATEQAVKKLVARFAAKDIEVKLGGGALRLARDGMGGTRTYIGKVSVDDSRALLVMDMPAPCDWNSFSWRISRANGNRELDGGTFVWSRDAARDGGMEWDINPAQLAQDGGGPGSYTVRLIHGREAVLTKTFKIEKSKRKNAPDRMERPVRGG